MYNYVFVYLFFIEGLWKKLFFTLIFSVHYWIHIGFFLKIKKLQKGCL